MTGEQLASVKGMLVGQTVVSARRGFATMVTIDFDVRQTDGARAGDAPTPSVWAQCRDWTIRSGSSDEDERVEVADGDGAIDWLDGRKVSDVLFDGHSLIIEFDRATARFGVMAEDELIEVFLPAAVVSFSPAGVRSTARANREPE